jgi:hypothetical protein
MALSTFEEAKLCPKCNQPGEDMQTIPAPAQARLPRGTTIHLIYCRTELCRWFDTCWQVQVNPDGSVPAPKDHTGEPKLYANIEGHDEIAQQIRDALALQVIAETKPGSEIRNPRG